MRALLALLMMSFLTAPAWGGVEYYPSPGMATNEIDAGTKTLNQLVAEIGSATKTLVISQTIPIGSATVVPENITLEFTGSGSINCGSVADSLSIRKMKNPGPRPIFVNCGSGTMRIYPKATDEVYYEMWGAVGNYGESYCTVTSGQATVTCQDPIFTSTAVDAGKKVSFIGAGSAGGVLSTTLSTVQSPTQATLVANASTTITTVNEKLSLGLLQMGTDDVAAIQATWDAVGWGAAGTGERAVPFRQLATYTVWGIQSTSGPGRQLFWSWDRMTMLGPGTLAGMSGRIPGGGMILLGGMTKFDTPTLRATNWAFQKWYLITGAVATFDDIQPVTINSYSVTLSSAANASKYEPNMTVVLRTGAFIGGQNTEPSSGQYIVSSVDSGAGIIYLKTPTTRPFAAECHVTGSTGPTTLDCSGGKTQSVLGMAPVEDRVIYDPVLDGAGWIGPVDASTIVGGQWWHLRAVNNNFKHGRNWMSVGTYRGAYCANNREHHNTAVNLYWMCSAATGTDDVLVENNDVDGPGHWHAHEDNVGYQLINNRTSCDTPNDTQSCVSLNHRQRKCVVTGNFFWANKPIGGAAIKMDLDQVYLPSCVITDNIITGIYAAGSAAISVDASSGVDLSRNNTDGALVTVSDSTLGYMDNDYGADKGPILLKPTDFVLASGSPAITLLATSNIPAWAFDAASKECIITVVKVPKEWKNLLVNFDWVNLGAGSGESRWMLDYMQTVPGDNMSTKTYSATPIFSNATAGAQNIFVQGVYPFASAKTITQGLGYNHRLYLRMCRDAANAADTLGNDSGLLSMMLYPAQITQ